MQAPWVWHGGVETCSGLIIYIFIIIVFSLVNLQIKQDTSIYGKLFEAGRTQQEHAYFEGLRCRNVDWSNWKWKQFRWYVMCFTAEGYNFRQMSRKTTPAHIRITQLPLNMASEQLHTNCKAGHDTIPSVLRLDPTFLSSTMSKRVRPSPRTITSEGFSAWVKMAGALINLCSQRDDVYIV